MTTSRCVGTDVSKDKLDVARLGDKRAWQVENVKEGIQKVVHHGPSGSFLTSSTE